MEEAVESGGSADLLEEWLQGFELPPLGSGEEPYVWLLRGLAETVERASTARVMARWLGEVFDRQPDVEPRGDFPDRLLFNAFYLAAGLAEPDELWEPLLGIYERRTLMGEYLGIEHRRALRVALTYNQGDAHMAEVWQGMAMGEDDSFLLGDFRDGFEGLTMMPHPELGRGFPALVALQEALRYQFERGDPRSGLKCALKRVCSLYPATERVLQREFEALGAKGLWSYHISWPLEPTWEDDRLRSGGWRG